MPTERKVAQVAALKDVIERAQVAISTQYQGVSMTKQIELRDRLREVGAEMHVVKNTLLRIAAHDAGREAFVELADGPTALVIGFDDPVGPSKALVQYIKDNADTKVAIRRAFVDGEIVDESYVQDLATLPSKDELIARLAGNLMGKIAEFNLLITATQREFAGLIEARATQLESESEAA